MKKTRTIPLGTLALALAVSCSGQENFTPVVVLSVGDVQVRSEGKQFTPARAARVILKGDLIRTGPASHLTIQIGNCGIVQIAPNSTLEANRLFESGSGELFLSRGTVTSRIDRLGKRNSYSVKTPTAIAAVRGTVFSVSCTDAASTVGVSRGRVQVTEVASGKEAQVHNGKAADVREGISIRDLGRTESLVMSKVDVVTTVENVQDVTPNTIEAKGRSFQPELEKIDRQIEEAPPATLEGIRARYGRIDVVTLYSGRVYRGAIIGRGESLTIIIPGGTVQVPARSVRQTASE
jgi:hypothetical protein